jgi:hypothetical protein
MGLFVVIVGVMSVGDVLLNMSCPTESERLEHEEQTAWMIPAMGGLFLTFLVYIIILIVIFAVRTKTKAVGITILILRIITMAITNLWGIIPFALLLAASIVALRYKPSTKVPDQTS